MSHPSLSTSTDPAPSAISHASASILHQAAFDRSNTSGPSRAAASSAGCCPNTLSTAWPSVTSDGRRGFGAASSFPSTIQPTPQHFRYNPFSLAEGEHKSRCAQLVAVESAGSGGFALESRTTVRLHQRCSGANRSAASTNTRLRNKLSTNPSRHGMVAASFRPIHGGSASITNRSRAAECHGPTSRASRDFALRHAVPTARCREQGRGRKGATTEWGNQDPSNPTPVQVPTRPTLFRRN